MAELPGSVLFACNQNSVRSPMAEAYLKHTLGHRIYVDSAGVRSMEINGFSIAVMDEIGIDLHRHKAKTFDDLVDTSFDVVISLAPEAHHRAIELTRTQAIEIEYWPTFDPTIVEGSREDKLEAFRSVRDSLIERIRARFPAPGAARFQ